MLNEDYLTKWQIVILRNFGIIPIDRIARVIETSEKNVIDNAKKLGIEDFVLDNNWVKKGFVTIIRSNWDLLTISQIAVLLNISETELNKILVEYDFLDVKLGQQPLIPTVKYSPLSKIEVINTEKARKIIVKNKIKSEVKPFDFYCNYVEPKHIASNKSKIKHRFISSYSAKYSGALLDDDLSDYDEEYLERLSKTGTNGIWLSDTLRNLAEFPFDKSLSSDYTTRIKNLKTLTERCSKFGIDVYLYMNEPRSLPESFFANYPELRGQKADDGSYCLCTSNEKVKNYLYNAFKSIAQKCPLLKGVMTITMSENPTHCYSRFWNNSSKIYTDCPNCKNKRPQDVVSEINNIIYKALKDGNGHTKLIANIWGWKNYSGIKNKEVFETIDLLDKDIEILCVSEYGKKFVRGGVKSIVDDYSISVVGPSEFARQVLTYAKEKGHKIWAKVQINNSWECSAVPYVPTFDLMEQHIRNLQELNIDGLMLGWSLGGYLGGVLPLINSICEDEKFDSKRWYRETYADKSEIVKKAEMIFSEAYSNYPFSVDSIYFGGHNLGPANMWGEKYSNRQSTMVCFTFEDFEKYVKPFGIEKYIELLNNVCSGFKKGLKLILDEKGNEAFEEFKNCALGTYIHLQSALNLAMYSKAKRDSSNFDVRKIIDKEKEITKELIKLIAIDNKIGFEMTNHYYYTKNVLLEKLVLLESLV